ncbi:hypothetical protein ACT7C8_20150 [Bacillus cereus]
MNIKVQDRSLEPLMNLKRLKKLNVSNQFPMEEYAKLSVVLQNTECEFLNHMYVWSPQKEKIL